MTEPLPYRNTDPATSKAAAKSINITRLEGMVVQALRMYGCATTEQLAERMGLSLVTVSPRMKPLETKGRVERVGKERNLWPSRYCLGIIGGKSSMMIKGFERGVFIYHSSMTEPFDDLCLHLQDCCGGCPYCVSLCQRVVDEANAITAQADTVPRCRHCFMQDCHGQCLSNALTGIYRSYEDEDQIAIARLGGKMPTTEECHEYRDEDRKEREATRSRWSAYRREDCATLPSKGDSTYVDIGRSWVRDFGGWLSRRYLQRVPD